MRPSYRNALKLATYPISMSDEQRNLFEFEEPTPWERDDRSENLVATVVFAVGGPPGEFDYLVPDPLAELIEPGRRIRVPLGRGNRLLTGYCIRIETKPMGRRRLKAVSTIVDRRSLLSPPMLRLTRWISEHYLCEWGQVLEAVVPAGVRGQAGTRLTLRLAVAPNANDRIREKKKELTQKQALVMQTLASSKQPMTPRELAEASNCKQGPITSLRRQGLIVTQTKREHQNRSAEPVVAQQPRLNLNTDQQSALKLILDTLHSGSHRTILLHGVTGSGKTEVYIQTIDEVVRFGRQAIVLVPEISLTPQTLERFRSRFGQVAVLHSHLTDAERHWQWQRIADGEVSVIVGARSAIFSPVPHLGLVVLDEEHESTFKQESVPRYHARDVAIERCRAEGVPLVLGSATPSLESWHRARSGEYVLAELPRRVLGRPMPAVGTIDMRNDVHSRFSRGAISRQLHAAIHEALQSDGQVVLLLNRRGFSTHIQCPACGEPVKCPHCEITLTHHRTEEIALCHYCDFQVSAPRECPQCSFSGIRYGGRGTQRLEAEIAARFPEAKCLRMDTDTMQGRGSHERALAAFRSGEVQILLGTQMIAKGLDFPNVTLVGVISADTALHLPDFRAAERTFHLITQVAGRTGRGERGGRVLVQTYNPDHPAIMAAVRHDYLGFATGELPMRQMFSYPPFSSIIRLIVRGPIEEVTNEFSGHIGVQLTLAVARHELDARVLGPAPAPFRKLRDKYRFQIQVQSADPDGLRAVVRESVSGLKAPADVQWMVDVDPLDML